MTKDEIESEYRGQLSKINFEREEHRKALNDIEAVRESVRTIYKDILGGVNAAVNAGIEREFIEHHQTELEEDLNKQMRILEQRELELKDKEKALNRREEDVYSEYIRQLRLFEEGDI